MNLTQTRLERWHVPTHRQELEQDLGKAGSRFFDPERRPEPPFICEAQARVCVEGIEGLRQLFDEALERLGQQLVHGAEVVVDEPMVHPCGFGDRSGSDACISDLVEKLFSGVQQGNGRLLARP